MYKIQGSLNQSSAQPPSFLEEDWNFQTHKGLTKREAIKWFILTSPPTVSNLLKVHSILIKCTYHGTITGILGPINGHDLGNFASVQAQTFSCVFLDQGNSDYSEEQHTAHLHRNPPELHSIFSLELLTRHIPNILNIFKGLLCSGRTNSSSSLGHHSSFLEEDAQSNGTEKNHSMRSHPKITGTANPITIIIPMPTKCCKN